MEFYIVRMAATVDGRRAGSNLQLVAAPNMYQARIKADDATAYWSRCSDIEPDFSFWQFQDPNQQQTMGQRINRQLDIERDWYRRKESQGPTEPINAMTPSQLLEEMKKAISGSTKANTPIFTLDEVGELISRML